jgi:hypothetical protein
MHHYTAVAPVGINAGALVKLTKKQAGKREHDAIQQQGKSTTYLVLSRIEFKAGETFHVDGELPKSMAELVEDKKADSDSPPPPPPAPPAPPAPAPAP